MHDTCQAQINACTGTLEYLSPSDAVNSNELDSSAPSKPQEEETARIGVGVGFGVGGVGGGGGVRRASALERVYKSPFDSTK